MTKSKKSYANIDAILHPPAISEPSNPNGTGNSSGGNSSGAGTGNSGGENPDNMDGNFVLISTSIQSKSTIKNKIISYPVQTKEGKVIRTSNYISDTVLMAKDEYLISKELGVKGDY